jgi:superfamily II DNA or RNA helicase
VPSNTVLGRQIRSGNEIDLNEIVVELDLEPLHYRLDHHVSKRPKFVKENFLTTDPALNPLTLLRKLTADHNANFRSNEQEDAASHLLNTKANLILILPTGSGKSMLVLLIASALPYYLTVVVVPTVALRQDLARRAEELAIRVAQSIEEFTNQNLLILTPEARTCPSAFKFFVDMKAKNRLYRIFIDEVHLVSTDSSWRESLKRLPMLGYFEIPLVLMSGTCPDHVVDEIQSSFFTDATKPVIIKQKSDRPSIRYAVNVCPSNESKLDQSLPYLQSLQFDEKAIIYVPYRSDTIEMSQFLCALGIQARAYHSELDDEERRANFADWRAGISSVMVATSAFGVGIDDPNVSLVVMLGLPYSFLEYIQASGRAARGSRNGLALLIIDEMEERRRLMRCSNLYERELVFDLLSYSLIRNVCRRRMIGTYLDGSCTSCEHLLGCEKCDACLPSAYILPHRSLVETVEASGEAFTIRENNADDDFRPFVPEAPREPFVGAKAAALQIISTEKASEISLSAVLKKINGFCGICLASERKAINHGSSYCPVAIGVCSICFLKGHSAKQCRLKTIAIPSKLLCYRCFQPWVVNGEKTHNDEDSCTNSTVVKDFYRRAAYAKLFDGISDTTFKPDIFYPALVRFCQSYLQ